MKAEPSRGWMAKIGLADPQARAWAMYDWANSGMITVIITAVFPAYFVETAASGLDVQTAQSRFSLATTLALTLVALSAPLLGALADARGSRKRFLLGFALAGVVATAAMVFIGPGDWELALVLFALANIGAAGSIVFYDALLPHVAAKGELDRLSTAGFALGYLGGGLLLLLNVLWILNPGWFGLPSGEDLTPEERTLPTRLAFLSVALWWGIFSIPLWRHVREPGSDRGVESGGQAVRRAFGRLRETLRELRRYRHAFGLLVAFLVYNDGVLTIIRMASLYAKSRSLDTSVIIGTILAIQFVGIPFALLFGRLARRFGPKRMILCGLGVYSAISVLAYFMTSNMHFVLLGLLVGSVQGGVQALSRSLFASMIPLEKTGEFFAFFAVGEKFAGIFGPLVFWLAIELTGSDQRAILSIIVFFLVGGFLLSRVDIEAGRRAVRFGDASP